MVRKEKRARRPENKKQKGIINGMKLVHDDGSMD